MPSTQVAGYSVSQVGIYIHCMQLIYLLVNIIVLYRLLL